MYEINTRDASFWTATDAPPSDRLLMQFGLVVVAAWVLLTALWYILPTARADLYDLLISRTTAKWCALGPGTPHTKALQPHDGWQPPRAKGCSLGRTGQDAAARSPVPFQVRGGPRSRDP